MTRENSLTEKIRDKEVYDSAKYLPAFIQGQSPYFASFSIEDEDSKIGRREYLLGKQSLFQGNKIDDKYRNRKKCSESQTLP